METSYHNQLTTIVHKLTILIMDTIEVSFLGHVRVEHIAANAPPIFKSETAFGSPAFYRKELSSKVFVFLAHSVSLFARLLLYRFVFIALKSTISVAGSGMVYRAFLVRVRQGSWLDTISVAN